MYRRLTILISIIIMFSAFCFRFTKELLSNISSIVFLDYLTTYPSSLSDNNTIIDFFVVLFIPAFIVEIIRFSIKMKFLEYLFHSIILALQCILVYLIILDGGSLWKTILYGKNINTYYCLIIFSRVPMVLLFL